MTDPVNKVYLSANSVSELKAAITDTYAQYLLLKSIEVTSSGEVKQIRENPDFNDYLQITLHWRGIVTATGKNHTVEKSFRLKSLDAKTVTLQQLQTLATTISNKFDSMNFTTGHVKCKYAKWKDGIWTWGYFDTKETGYRIIEAMGDIAGKPIDKGLFRYENVLEEGEIYDPTPSKVTIAGKLIRPRAKAPIAEMKWYAATILFPWVGHEEQLCNVNGYVIQSLKFLDAYDD